MCSSHCHLVCVMQLGVVRRIMPSRHHSRDRLGDHCTSHRSCCNEGGFPWKYLESVYCDVRFDYWDVDRLLRHIVSALTGRCRGRSIMFLHMRTIRITQPDLVAAN